jgi:hypothetical protein
LSAMSSGVETEEPSGRPMAGAGAHPGGERWREGEEGAGAPAASAAR